MGWLLLTGVVVGAWALLSVLSVERERRVRELDFAAAARRQAAVRAALIAEKAAVAAARAALRAAQTEPAPVSPASSQPVN